MSSNLCNGSSSIEQTRIIHFKDLIPMVDIQWLSQHWGILKGRKKLGSRVINSWDIIYFQDLDICSIAKMGSFWLSWFLFQVDVICFYVLKLFFSRIAGRKLLVFALIAANVTWCRGNFVETVCIWGIMWLSKTLLINLVYVLCIAHLIFSVLFGKMSIRVHIHSVLVWP